MTTYYLGIDVQGVTGIQGQTGPSTAGSTGPMGPTGISIQGLTGLQGETGIVGIQGLTGVQGMQGVTGLQGVTGSGGSGVSGDYVKSGQDILYHAYDDGEFQKGSNRDYTVDTGLNLTIDNNHNRVYMRDIRSLSYGLPFNLGAQFSSSGTWNHLHGNYSMGSIVSLMFDSWKPDTNFATVGESRAMWDVYIDPNVYPTSSRFPRLLTKRVTTAHYSSDHGPGASDQATYWDWVAEWFQDTSYNSDVYSTSNGTLYKSKIAHFSGTREPQYGTGWASYWTELQTYNSETSYSTGAVVQYSGVRYTSLQDSNLGNDPSSSPTYWQAESTSSWAQDTSYTSGNYVDYYGTIYSCSQDHFSGTRQPGYGTGWTTAWEEVDPQPSEWVGCLKYWRCSDRYYDSGSGWYGVSAPTFNDGDQVINKDDDVYECISTHTPTEDDEPGYGDNWETYWQLVTPTPTLAPTYTATTSIVAYSYAFAICKLTHVATAHEPQVDALWADCWADSYVGIVKPSSMSDGTGTIATYGWAYDYVCISGHTASSSNHPLVDGSKWVPYDSTVMQNLSWSSALEKSYLFSMCGFHDWRMPNIRELSGIFDYGKYRPSVDTGMLLLPSTGCNLWSSTTQRGATGSAWYCDTTNGISTVQAKSSSARLLLVRNKGTESAPYLYDAVDREDQDGAGDLWDVVSGGSNIVTRGRCITTKSNTNTWCLLIAATPPETANHAIRARYFPNGSTRLYLRYADSENFISAEVHPAFDYGFKVFVTVYKVVSGVPTLLLNSVIGDNAGGVPLFYHWPMFEFWCSGTSYRFYFDGVLVGSFTDGDLGSNVNVGFDMLDDLSMPSLVRDIYISWIS